MIISYVGLIISDAVSVKENTKRYRAVKKIINYAPNLNYKKIRL